MVGPIKLLVNTINNKNLGTNWIKYSSSICLSIAFFCIVFLMYFMFKLSMEGLSSKDLTWVFMLLLIQICGAKGCIEEEKMGLLEFKAFLKVNDKNADFLLPSWIDHNKISKCCSWERVICNPTTGRVEKLFLNNIRQQQHWFYYGNDKFWLLNVSMFLPFKELHHLNLSANSFDGFIENEGMIFLTFEIYVHVYSKHSKETSYQSSS